MGDDGFESPLSKSSGQFVQVVVQRSGSRLQQNPSSVLAIASSSVARPFVPAERHRMQLLIAQTVGLGLGQLPAGKDSHADSLSVQVRLQRANARGNLLDAHVVVVPYMGRRAHRHDPVPLGLSCHREAVVEIARAVVESRQDVAVQIDHVVVGHVPANAFSGVMRVTRHAG